MEVYTFASCFCWFGANCGFSRFYSPPRQSSYHLCCRFWLCCTSEVVFSVYMAMHSPKSLLLGIFVEPLLSTPSKRRVSSKTALRCPQHVHSMSSLCEEFIQKASLMKAVFLCAQFSWQPHNAERMVLY